MDFRPHRLVYNKPDTAPRVEAQNAAPPAGGEVSQRVKDAHEEQRKALVDTFTPHLKSDDAEIRKTANDAMTALTQLEAGSLLSANAVKAFQAKYMLIIESHKQKKTARENVAVKDTDETQRNALVDTFSPYLKSDNPEIRKAAVEAMTALMQLAPGSLPSESAKDAFQAKYMMTIEYHLQRESASEQLKVIKDATEASRKIVRESQTKIFQEFLDQYKELSVEDRAELEVLRNTIIGNSIALIDSEQKKYTMPEISLEDYKANPGVMISKIDELTRGVQAVGLSNNPRLTNPINQEINLNMAKAEAIVRNAESVSTDRAMTEVDADVTRANKQLAKLRSEGKNTSTASVNILNLAQNAKALVNHFNTPQQNQQRALVLCQLVDDIYREIETVKTGVAPKTRVQNVTEALRVQYKFEQSDRSRAFASIPAIIRNTSELRNKVGQKLQFKEGAEFPLLTDAGLTLATTSTGANLILSSADIYRIQGPDNKDIDYVRVKVPSPNGPEFLIPRSVIA